MTSNTVTDYDIQALVDNELDNERTKQVLNHLESNSQAHKRYKELTAQKNVLKLWWKDKLVS